MALVLVIDDSPTVVQFVRDHLLPLGHEVDNLQVFTELYRYLRERQPDLILLDLEMPSLSGIAFAKFVRRFEVTATPILVHSSRPDHEVQAACSAIGALGAVPKGLAPIEFTKRVRDFLAVQLATAPSAGH